MRVILLIVVLLFVIGVGEEECWTCDHTLHGYCKQLYNVTDNVIESCYALEPALCQETLNGNRCSCPNGYEEVVTGIVLFDGADGKYKRKYISCYNKR